MNQSNQTTEKWGIFEGALSGPQNGNPFLEVELSTRFQFQHRSIEVNGFYDGDGIYRVRFMPDEIGEWSYVTRSNAGELDGKEGSFTCTKPGEGNRGPVRVHNTHHFAYADGTPHYSFGTTCYVWNHQGDAMEEQTLETLKTAPFNKLRMCVFPKYYDFNKGEPPRFPFPKDGDSWDFTQFNPEYFQHLEKRVGDLMKLGIEADIILFHSYDRWGFAEMDAEVDDRYLKYVVARLSAYRNVWWSMANEYDLMKAKSMADWDRFFRIVQEDDPSQHLRSIHNAYGFYDHNKPWVTHVSVQHNDLQKVSEWAKQYQKPIVVDECGYEGNIPNPWGNFPARELVHRFWEGTVRGGYVGHGETYDHPQDLIWWSKGGELHGESPARIAFLRRIVEEGPACAYQLTNASLGGIIGAPKVSKDDRWFLIYYGIHQPIRIPVDLPPALKLTAEVIDTWEMTVTPLPGTFEGKCDIPLTGRPFLALRLIAVD